MMNKYWEHNDLTTLLILAPLVTLFAFGLDFYIPIVPLLKDLYGTTHEVMQLTLSGFMFLCAIGQIIAGPLCDKYGRRPTALTCLILFIIGSIICPIHTSLSMMLLGRLLQAIGASGTFLCGYATVRDLYPSPSQSTKIYSYINMCISQAPIFAPTISGIIVQHTSWQMVFVILMCIGIITFFIANQYYLETSPKKQTTNYQHLLSSYRLVIFSRRFQIYSLASATGMGSFFMFFSQSPYIIMETLGYSKPLFGMFFGIVGLSFFIASLFTHTLTQQYNTHTTVSIGASLMVLGSLLLILFQAIWGTTIIGFIFPMMIVVSGAAYCIGAGLAGTMEPYGSIAGIAFSAVGFIKFAFSAALGLLLMRLPASPYTLGLLIFQFSSLCVILCKYYQPKRLAANLLI